MTKFDFMMACGAVMIEPDMALENDLIVEALKQRDDEKVRELLASQF